MYYIVDNRGIVYAESCNDKKIQAMLEAILERDIEAREYEAEVMEI